MTEKLLKMQGEKLPCEKVWVDAHMMYEINDSIELDINGEGARRYYITDIIEDGVVVVDAH